VFLQRTENLHGVVRNRNSAKTVSPCSGRRSIDGQNGPINEVVPGRCVAEGQPGGGHGGDDEKKAPEISGVNATLGNQVVDRTGKQEGEDCGGDREGSQMDQG